MKQYECNNIWQVASKIAELTNTKTTKDDWKEMCYDVKKDGSSDFVDYLCFKNDEEFDCSVFIGYDSCTKQYLVGVEIDEESEDIEEEQDYEIDEGI